jgi:hypothetical protein
LKESKKFKEKRKFKKIIKMCLKFNLINSINLLIILHLSSATHHHNHHRHRHRHKHQVLTIDSNQIHDIREAFNAYRNTVNKDMLMPLRHHQNRIVEEETLPAVHQHNQHSMHRHKRVHTTPRITTTTKALDNNYDEEYDDESDASNRKVNDDARVHQPRNAVQVRLFN